MDVAATYSPENHNDNARADRATKASRNRNKPNSRRSGGSYRTTLYRLDGVPPNPDGLRRALNNRYLRGQDFEIHPTTVSDAPALLVHGHVPRDRADWCPVITGLTGNAVAVGYSSAGGALLVAVDGVVYALTYGTVGRHMINPDLYDPGFGIGFAIRAVGPERIMRITRRMLASTGRTDRSQVPGGLHIRQFNIERWGEIVGQLCGTLLDNPRLTVTRLTKRPVSVAGANSLQIPLSVDPVGLLDDLREITRVSAVDTPSPELEFIAQVQPLPTGARTQELDEHLDDLLGQVAPDGLALTMPISQAEYEPLAVAYEIKTVGSRRAHLSELDFEAVLERARTRPAGMRLKALKNGTIALCANKHGDLLTPPESAHKWITAEIANGNARMIYQEGKWYEIGEHHLDFLGTEIEEILSRPPTIALPPWTTSLANEDAYNKHAARHGFVLLDKRLLKTRQHPYGIEGCDLLGPDNELIHVKRADRSSPLSHLFYQGEVAIDALRYERDARAQLAKMVRHADPGRGFTAAFRPKKIVYAIALSSGKPLSAKTLFTFSQVALYRAVRRLRSDNIDVEVIGIPPR
ncbi:DUF6119 family protein [Dactylosporangium sp. NPDC051485]|uniref:DUF6119 family protein n=1 Tax=Dactylosporangium sp. NPDC051485 TaxID=3154846 RepID=UPI003426F8E4